MSAHRIIIVTWMVLFASSIVLGKVAFEKLTELDYRGSTYYTIRNLSLWECQGWCREEPECSAASFSFVMNPLAPIQETLCLLQNETMASNPSASPQRAVSLYYMVKLSVRTEQVCNRPWTFERVPNKMLKGHDNMLIFTSTKEACLASCLNERRFTCRSVEYNYVTLQCHMSEQDRRSSDEDVEMIDVNGVDYFENLCLGASESCRGERDYEEPELGVPLDRVAHYVDMHYYVDKELMANSLAACKRACEIEKEFLCRSFLYKGSPSGQSYNCQLFHLDHYTLPDGPSTFLSTDRPLLDDGERTGQYFENVCKNAEDNMICKQVTTRDKRFITQIICYEKATKSRQVDLEKLESESSTLVPFPSTFPQSTSSGLGTGTTSLTTLRPDISGENINCDNTGVCYDVSVHCKDTRIVVEVMTNRPFSGRIYALGRSETCNVDVINSTKFRLDLTMSGQDCNTAGGSGEYRNTIVIQHHSIVMTKTDKIYRIKCTYDMSSKNITFGMLPISRPTGGSEFLKDSLNVRDPDTIPITSAPEAPPPRIRILSYANMTEVQTVRIGDRLIFRIEIPEKTPYGIFARSCVAMAKDGRTTFQIIDKDGCPVEPSIFPHFTLKGTGLESVYEAFRFTESYGVIFQCNVKYCLGPCEPARCSKGRETLLSYGRKKRSLELTNKDTKGFVQETTKEEVLAAASSDTVKGDEELSISQEILVLDLGDTQSPQYKAEPKLSARENYYNSSLNFDGPDVTLFETCPTRSSVLALAVTCAILLLIYVLTIFYFLMRKWFRPSKSVR